jgi:hypothetical protein
LHVEFERGMKSSLAIAYLVKEDKEPTETNSDTSLSNDSSANSSFDEILLSVLNFQSANL